MKTKPKPRARRMWANYYSNFPLPDVFQSKVRAMSWATDYSATVKTVPVAVIPLDDMPALQSTAYNAYCAAQDANLDSMECVIAALTAIGVLPRKGGRK